jgi:serine/threonine protein kinase/tetratricopeptide (TPR) repeat protein
VCGQPFDFDVTGAVSVALVSGSAQDETRFAHAPLVTQIARNLAALDPDITAAGIPLPPSGNGGRPGSSAGTRHPAPASRAAAGRLEVGGAFGDRYHIIRMLGQGGMGAVYQAWDAELEVALALKVIRPDAIADPEAAAEIERRFKRELLLARQVTHPNVVRIHDLGELDGIKYITMPYIKGTDLSEILEAKGTLPVAEALHIASQIAAGLLAAHAAGVVHRDLKPANIMIDADRRALITDFGIARGSTGPESPAVGGEPAASRFGALQEIDEGATRIGTVVGSIEYMAPEQARGEHVDLRADIYSFGLILRRMLVGKRLAPGATDILTDLQARMTTAPGRLREVDGTIPEAVDEIVSRCVQPDPAARFQATAELVAALNRLDAQGIPLPLPIQLLRSVRFWTSAAIAAIAIVATTWLIAGRPAPPPPDPVAILVADFSNTTGEPVFDGLMEQAVTVGVEGASFITALPRASAVRVARLIKAGTRLDEPTARLVALREGVKVVLLGSIDKSGSGYALSVEGVDPSSRKVLFASTATARDRDGVLRVGATLAARVRASLGDTRAVDPKETLSTASLEAVSAYTRAQELSSAGKDQEAIEYFRKAASLDPGFGRAYGGLAMSATRLGRREEAAKLWQEALKHLDVMSEREQYRLLGAYYTLVTRNFETARDTYEKLVKQYPADGAGHNNLAVAYFRGLQFGKALNEGRLVRQIYPNSPLYRSNYALYAMYAGDFPLASTEAQKLVDDGLASYDTYLPLAVSAIADGKLGVARETYALMAKTDDAGASLAATGLADLALSEGRAAEAVAILQAGITADQAQQNPAGVSAKEVALADALGMQSDFKGAVAAARRALAFDKTESQILPAVRWLIAANRIDEAAQLGAELDQRLEAQARAHGRIVAAQVAMARGKRVEAVDAMREALKLADLWLVRFNLGQAYLAAGAPAEAFSEFETCLKRRGEGYAAFLDDVPTARAVAPVGYWMARAHQGMGLGAQALSDYRAFIAGRAPDSPEPLLKDARIRAGTLQ